MDKKRKRAVIIVESPAKTRTIRRFVGDDFEVVATMGHVRDLPEHTFGVDVKNGFKPKFVIIPSKRKAINHLRKVVKNAEKVYLASDPDREGEAIAWHVSQVLRLKNPLRIEFTEITQRAVTEALKNPRRIDMNRVNAQLARRILDRIVGYRLSPFLWWKVRGARALSAGRVQSVALRMVCEREKEIEEFVPQEYWTITAVLEKPSTGERFEALLHKIDGQKPSIPNREEAERIVNELKGQEFVVAKVTKKLQRRNPPAPFITSTMQQEASNRLRFSPSKTMLLAQQLYEGLEVGEEGHVGLITYMRTDSVRVAPEAQEEARQFLLENYGPQYLPEKPPTYRSRATAQEAHECIRPTSVRRTPEYLRQFLERDQVRLYELIWRRFLASQSVPAQIEVTSASIRSGKYAFRAAGTAVKFDGFLRFWKPVTKGEERKLPPLEEGEVLRLVELKPEQHFTKPPPRYSEATLIRALEENGVGRPSTYAPTVSLLLDRGYVRYDESRRLVPTELGKTVNEILTTLFPDIIDVEFTAKMEEALDKIERGQADHLSLLRSFYPSFMKKLREAKKNFEAVTVERGEKELEEKCPQCGRPLVVKEGRHGRFISCSGFPQCKFKKPFALEVRCPLCGGEIIERYSTRRRRAFYSCANFPDCKFASWDLPVDRKCPLCGTIMSERVSKSGKVTYTCLNPECRFKLSEEPTEGSEGQE